MVVDYFQLELPRGVRVAVPVAAMVEVADCRRAQLCPLPGLPRVLLGVLNQRGRLLWVLDLAQLLQVAPAATAPPRPQDKLTVAILGDPAGRGVRLGCTVAALRGIVTLTGDLQPPPVALAPGIRSLLAGMGEVDGALLAVLNVEALLAALHHSSRSASHSLVSR